MNKIFVLLASAILLSGCAETFAFLGSATGGGNAARTAFSQTVSYGIKKQTGKTPMEHALKKVEKKYSNGKKSKCVFFLEENESIICEVLKDNISKTKEIILEKSKVKDLAKN